MNWKEILKTEKLAPLAATAGAVAFASRKALKDKEKIDVDKPTLEKLTGRQKEIDANNDGKISRSDRSFVDGFEENKKDWKLFNQEQAKKEMKFIEKMTKTDLMKDEFS